MLAPLPDPRPEDRGRADGFPIAENLCAVVMNEAVNDRYRHLVLAAPPAALDVQPGQFFHLLCPATGSCQPFLRRPMSVYRIDRAQGRIEFLYKVIGAGTQAMAALRPGDPFNALGPLGIGFSLDPAWRNIVVVARGVGLATLAPLADLAIERGIAVTAILSAASPDYLMSVDLFRRAGEVITVTDSDGTSDSANVEAIVRRLITAGRADAFFTCGSNRLMLLLKALGRAHGIPGQVALEQQMACGLGMCFCCVRGFEGRDGEVVARRVCCEGPVFDLQEALSW